MEIEILQLVNGARQAKGLTIIIDVFRAFSTACYVFAAGAEKIIPVEHVKDAFELKEQFPDALLMGERHERKVEGFDFGNSPTHLMGQNLKGKTLIMTTSSGTRGIMNAHNADEILTGSFVNAGAIISYIQSQNPAVVSLVCMGYEAQTPTQEDTFLAEYILDNLQGKSPDFDQMKQILRTGDGARLLDPANSEWSPATDFDLCLALNRFNFVLKVEKEDEFHFLERVYV
jgi:2-phosphosulfolactate phosphatase